MKKLPTLLISILITSTVFSSLFSAKTQALYTDENSITWYTIPELLEYKKEHDQEEQEVCGDNMDCLMAFREEKSLSNPKYAALRLIEFRQLFISSVNLRDNTIKFVFFKEDMRAKRSGGPRRDTELDSLFIAWLDGMREIPSDYDGNIDKYHNGEISNVHPIYAYKKEADNINQFTETDQELEIEVPVGSDLKNDTLRSIHFKMRSKYSNMSGYVGYSRCMFATDRNPDTICTAMISSDERIEYFASLLPAGENNEEPETPSEPEQPEQPSEPETPSEPEQPNPGEPEYPNEPNRPEQPSEPETPSGPERPGLTEPENLIQPISGEPKTPIMIQPNNNTPLFVAVPKSPNTGSMASPCSQKTIEFPWWLCIIIALGDMVVLWFFWPTPKSPKNPKKV